MNATLIINYFFTAMQDKKNLCECHSRLFNFGKENKFSNYVYLMFWYISVELILVNIGYEIFFTGVQKYFLCIMANRVKFVKMS